MTSNTLSLNSNVSIHSSSTDGAIKHLLLIRLDHIGDFLLTVPHLVKSIQLTHVDLTISIMTTSRAAPFARTIPGVRDVFTVDPPWNVPEADGASGPFKRYLKLTRDWMTSRWLSRPPFDALAFLSFSAPEKLFFSSLAPLRAGFIGPYTSTRHRISNSLLTHTLPFNPSTHLLDNCTVLLQTLLQNKLPRVVNRLSPPPSHKGGTLVLGDEHVSPPFVGIHPGGLGSFKNWPLESFADLIDHLRSGTSYSFKLLGGPEQADSIRTITDRIGCQRIQVVITPDFESLAHHISSSVVFLANDGGPAHLGATLGIPTCVIFGPTDERIYGPVGEHVRVIRSMTPDPRLDYPWQPGPRVMPATSLRTLSVDHVFQVMMKTLHDVEVG